MFHKILNRTTGRHWTNGVGADIFFELIVTFIRGVPRTLSNIYNLFVANAPFLYPLKSSENLTVFLFFQKGWIGNKWDNETFSENNSIIDGSRPKYVLVSIGLCVRRVHFLFY